MITVPKLPRVKKLQSIGVLTSGGDAPGMNAAVRAVVRYGITHGCQVKGILRGYSGLFEKHFVDLRAASVANVIQRGGTILKTDRCQAFFEKSGRKKAAETLHQEGIDALVVIGGDGSFTGAHLLEKETGFPVIGVPGTIDNDIAGTEDTIGFDTAVNTAIEAIDRIRDTASSHNRIFVVEVMGHSSGFIGLQVALAGGAETVLIPEKKEPIEKVCKKIEHGVRRGKTSSIIVVSEGPKPGLANRLSDDLAKKGYRSRVCILGHIQRGGPPTTHDRVLASVLGASAVAYLLAGKSSSMVGIQNGNIALVPFSKIIGHRKKLMNDPMSLIQILSN